VDFASCFGATLTLLRKTERQEAARLVISEGRTIPHGLKARFVRITVPMPFRARSSPLLFCESHIASLETDCSLPVRYTIICRRFVSPTTSTFMPLGISWGWIETFALVPDRGPRTGFSDHLRQAVPSATAVQIRFSFEWVASPHIASKTGNCFYEATMRPGGLCLALF